ncbi:3-hydroxyacyl-CoA dehydrogenase [Calidifontibacter sp. DB0510]|uniref:3-hydroxyacyl-CoA dehydrogenase n=1 Tax=Metallococcus carri TaxID=1656884 RepID=A0A967B056_9MICO|nr:3-hydroxybutyryl-CoA dehydrogenase [Metallococcus carri]NHN56346.1 3-hydroxyacyl-CoA dehydrogenase [Metallococcus carri]NOP35970.1 3-hydroxyacyl-CoA dehydrogenase [Calidifontibacter sp. DB2511S]
MTVEIQTVGVIGLGTMGAGIVEVFAKAGLRVIAVDGSPELAERGKGFLTRSLDRAVERGRLEQSARDAALEAVTFSAELADLAPVDLVIEAVPERLEIKTSIFASVDEIVREDAIIASNTSSLSLTAIAAATKHPQRVVGMHFFNPAPVLKLVEVITTVLVDDEVVEAVRSLAERLGKQPVVVRDRAGFVANALLITYLARAIRTYETGHVSREDLDDAARIGLGLPMGPLTLADLIGLDVVKEVCDVLYAATKEPSAAPPALLEQLVTAGHLGRKTGRGFYNYDKPGSGTVTDAPEPSAEPVAAQSVSIIGEGPVAEELGKVLRDGGVSVTAYGRTSEDLPHDAEVAFVVGDEVTEDEDDAWFVEAIAALPATAVVACLDGLAQLAVTGYLEDGAQMASLQLHGATKAGQIAEIARPLGADDAAIDRLADTLRAAGLRTIVARDRAGLVVDALLLPQINDAVRMLDAGYASVEDIDTAMTAGCGYPQGLFAYADQLGAAEVSLGLQDMYDETGEPGLRPSPLLDEHAAAGLPFRD